MALSRDPLARILAASPLLLALACKAPGSAGSAQSAGPFVPTLSIRPVAVSLGVGATQAFQAELTVQKDGHYQGSPVGWRVMESGGGTINGTGVYTAPATPGVYHIQARREDFTEVTALATVTVK